MLLENHSLHDEEYSVQQLLLAAEYTDSVKTAHGFTNEVKQAPLTRKVKRGIEIPKILSGRWQLHQPAMACGEEKGNEGHSRS